MKVYDFEHHGYSKSVEDYLRSNTEGYPRIDENNSTVYNDAFTMPLSMPSFISPNTMFDDIIDFDDERLANLDKAGVSNACISSFDALEMLPREDCIKVAKQANDEMAAAVKRHPDRFIGTITLPTPYVDVALEELDRAVNELGLA